MKKSRVEKCFICLITMKKVTDLGEEECIHCKTEEEAKAICKLMHDAGLKWCT
jgi:hypothetical protein